MEELVPLGAIDKDKLIKTIQGLSPKGKTPISRSVRLTAERIKHLEDETTIILVSDGKETCDPDPCGLVKDLKASGIRFIMHVIGFDVTEEEKQELECMAKEGGGRYFTAGNAGEFSAAASEVVKKPAPTYGTLRIMVSKNGKPFFTAITLTNLETGKSWAPGSPSDETGIAERRLEPGNYTAELKDLSVIGGKTPTVKLTDIVIVAGETMERNADFSDGTLVITTLRNGIPFNGHISYYRQGENKHFRNQNAHSITGQLKHQFLPGVYRVEVKTDSIVGDPTVVFDSLEILPGSTVEKTAEFFSGEVTVASTLNGEPYAMPFKVYDSSGKEMYKSWTQGQTYGTRLVRLPSGTYTIKVTTNVDGSTKSFENVTVETGQSQTVEAAFSFGKLTIAATLNGQPFSTPFKIYDSAGKQVRKNWTQNGQRTEMLAEGMYTIKVINIKNNKQVMTFEDVEVKTGETTERTGSFGE
ncbi:MAG: T9SS type A sorting domain-containing protein [Desulfobacterales bacterium]|nr:T9SS type A sorting domain-containing protein [Desulfobacterales bacterium]